MFKNLNCLIGIINTDNLVICKLGNFKVDLKDNSTIEKTRMLQASLITTLLNDMKFVVLKN